MIIPNLWFARLSIVFFGVWFWACSTDKGDGRFEDPLLSDTVLLVDEFFPPRDTLNGCPPHGSAKRAFNKALNLLKNRSGFPSADRFDTNVTLAALRSGGNDRNRWSERYAARIQGYVKSVKLAGPESCNCDSKLAAFRDIHIVLVPNPDSDETDGVVAEVTPRMRIKMAGKGQDWSDSTLRRRLTGQRVEVSGWLFFDDEHDDESANTGSNTGRVWRATAWEIHPVTGITIFAKHSRNSPQTIP